MRKTVLLIGSMAIVLAACETASEPVSVDLAAGSDALQAQVSTGPGRLVPVTFSTKQVSHGTGQIIGWCDEPAGVARATAPGTGTGSAIGRFEIDQTMCVDMVTGAVTGGAATAIAANGDEIHFVFEGQALPGFTLPVYDLAYTVVGGTGRFASAEGELQIHVVYDSPATWTATGGGWLRYAPSDRSDR